MKILITVAALVLSLVIFVGVVKADTIKSTSSSDAVSGSESGSSNSFDQKFDSHNSASDLGRMVPAAVAPALSTTLTETCMGSMSMGLSVVGFGMSGGATYTDEECVRRLDARQMHMLGDAGLAREIMCDSPQVRAAAIRVGRPCVADKGMVVGQPVVLLSSPAYKQDEAVTVVDKTAVGSQCANPALTEGGRAACVRRLGL